MQARGEEALLERAFIGDVLDLVGAEFEEAKEGVAFGRCSVADDALAG
jgi:hypothetical protein